MRAAVLESHGEPLSITTVDKPEVTPDGAVVEVEACGVCRSDWHGWQGDWDWLGIQLEAGQIAERPEFPCFFAGYWERPERTAECFVDGPDGEWYLSGDLGRIDEDGYFWFEGRADDVILSSGYRIGPFEVESALGEHEAVAEAAVVSKPDNERGNIVKAYIVASQGVDPGERTKADIKESVKRNLAAHEYPREIEFLDELPKTVTGKIRRTELRDRTTSATTGD